jgi:fructose-1,6-bisphosphatase/inositol monophosphatase family enzyme
VDCGPSLVTTNLNKPPQAPYGRVTPSMVGLAMKEMVRRAIKAIRNQRFVFDAQHKTHLDESTDDLVTTADHEAQEIYLSAIQKCFPNFGIIAEEDELRVPCQIHGRKLYFTIDPLDGTKAFARRQSAGVGTMIALVDGSQVIAAYVGDVMTQEIYGFRPESDRVHRISEFETAELLENNDKLVETSYVLLRDQPKRFSKPVAELVSRFRGLDVEGGSIGISYARLWKQEVDALLTGPYFATPWDSAPIIGISRKLGYRFIKLCSDGSMEELSLTPPSEPVRHDHHLLVVNEKTLRALLSS